ncbi:hypothetical protein RFI_32456 [Reticulomyxa filosa]|uniref:SAM domain-containing protein n=1 Tax=Reticulomyxa filosa TaxID=46433 RepID=X6LUA9_RETFI|nr:hypothetical protein RFI_32456 [Reticulomyxa filosa]|eukprot:ETO04941.1 hypothetical protein RFI_32456 [Reticulomyxa filosa]
MDKSDVSAWLAVNKLSYIEPTFLERNISIEELADFNTEELRDFAKDLKLDALATRRFIKAIEDQKVLGGGGNKKKPKQLQKMFSDVSVGDEAEAAPAFDYNIPEGLVDEGEKEGMEGGNAGLGEGEDEDKPVAKEKEERASMKISAVFFPDSNNDLLRFFILKKNLILKKGGGGGGRPFEQDKNIKKNFHPPFFFFFCKVCKSEH